MGFIEPKDNRTCFAHKRYLTEPVDLCQRNVTLTLDKLNTAQIGNENNLSYARSI